MLKQILHLMRIKHYIKNILILVPLFFSQQLMNMEKLIPTLWGMLSFCLISSSVYIINDIFDIEKDRLHPTKKYRPLASGAVKISVAVFLFVFCIGIALFINFMYFWGSSIWLIIYLILNVAYSLNLKNRPIIDVAILASGFLIRIIYGASLTFTYISEWLYLTVISGALYLGLGKRRNELQKQGAEGITRNVLKQYNYNFLDKNMYICLALTDCFYALWAIDRETPMLVWSVPMVILIFMKYSLDIENNSDGDPVEVILSDKILTILCLGYIIYTVGILYFM